jgi:hypothetical protein
MIVNCFRAGNGSIYMDEFTNDIDKINDTLDTHPNSLFLNSVYDDLVDSFSDEKWNNYVAVMISMLEESGCEIVWI